MNEVWAAISAIASVVSASAIYLAVRQLKFNSWIKAQELFTIKEFVESRKLVNRKFTNPEEAWTDEEKEQALYLCRRMDELAWLSPYLSKRKIINVWGYPIAKSWLVVETFVIEERRISKWPEKWKAYENIAIKALKKTGINQT